MREYYLNIKDYRLLTGTLLVIYYYFQDVVVRPLWAQDAGYDPNRLFPADSLKADLHFLQELLTGKDITREKPCN